MHNNEKAVKTVLLCSEGKTMEYTGKRLEDMVK